MTQEKHWQAQGQKQQKRKKAPRKADSAIESTKALIRRLKEIEYRGE